MADRMFKAGHRQAKRYQPPEGRISKNRFAWLRTAIGQFVVMRYAQDDRTDDDVKNDREVGDTYTLVIPLQGRRPVTLNITALTYIEFQKTRQLFNLLFDLAEPVIRERDKVAQDAFANGDDSYTRVYREVPKLIVRERQERTDLQGVQYGPSGVPGGVGGDESPTGGLRRDGDELADGEQEESRGQDDRAATD